VGDLAYLIALSTTLLAWGRLADLVGCGACSWAVRPSRSAPVLQVRAGALVAGAARGAGVGAAILFAVGPAAAAVPAAEQLVGGYGVLSMAASVG
jgi:hypothetical protein